MRSTLNCEMEQKWQWRKVDDVCTNCRTINWTTKNVDRDGNKWIKNRKATGHDQTMAKLIEEGGKDLKKVIYELILKILEEESGNMALVCPIHMKEYVMQDNYRAVTLLCTTYQILASILCWGNNGIPGRLSKGKINCELNVLLWHKYWKNVGNTKKGTSSIYWLSSSKWQNIEWIAKTGFWGGGNSFHRIFNSEIQSMVKNGKHLFSEFKVSKGLWQEDAIAPLLFSIVLESEIRSKGETQGTISDKCSQIMAHADDVVIIGRRFQDVKKVFTSLVKQINKIGLEIN